MKIHEFQAKKLFREAGIAVLRNEMVDSPEAAAAAYDALGSAIAVVKAQIHAGGRGKGTVAEVPSQHGVQLVRSREEAAQVAKNLLGNRLVVVERRGRANRPLRARRGRLQDCPRTVPGDCARSGRLAAGAHGLHRRGRGN